MPLHTWETNRSRKERPMPTWEERAAALRERAQAREQKRQETKQTWEEKKAEIRARNTARRAARQERTNIDKPVVGDDILGTAAAAPKTSQETIASSAAPTNMAAAAPDVGSSLIDQTQLPGQEPPMVDRPSLQHENVESTNPRVKTKMPDFVTESLHGSELVLGTFSASLMDHRHRKDQFRHDKFVLTDQRIICYHTALVHKGMSQIPYTAVTNVTSNRGFRHGKVVIDTSSGVGLTIDGIN